MPRPVTQQDIDTFYNRSIFFLILGFVSVLFGSLLAVWIAFIIAFLYSRIAIHGEKMLKEGSS